MNPYQIIGLGLAVIFILTIFLMIHIYLWVNTIY